MEMTPDQIEKELREIHDVFHLIKYAADTGKYLCSKLGDPLLTSMLERKGREGRMKTTEALIQIYSEIAAECGLTLPPMTVDLEFEAAVEADRKLRGVHEA